MANCELKNRACILFREILFCYPNRRQSEFTPEIEEWLQRHGRITQDIENTEAWESARTLLEKIWGELLEETVAAIRESGEKSYNVVFRIDLIDRISAWSNDLNEVGVLASASLCF